MQSPYWIKWFMLLIGVSLLGCNSHSEKKLKATYSNNTLQDDLRTKADKYYQSEMYDSAKITYDSLISIDSTVAEYFFNRAYSKSMLSFEGKSIIDDYLTAIKYNYKNKSSALYNIGSEYLFKVLFRDSTNEARKSHSDSALFYYNECLKINPSHSEAALRKKELSEFLTSLKAKSNNEN